MKHYILLMQRNNQSTFTFVQRVLPGTVGYGQESYQQSLGNAIIVMAEILNYRDCMDLDDMIIQHPYIENWKLKYIGNCMFSQ